MTLNLYVNNSPKNKIGKSLTATGTITGTLRHTKATVESPNKYYNTSVVDPEFEINDVSTAINSNYAYIPEFKRYYFIEDVRSSKNGLWIVVLHCDVLETFKPNILNNTGIIARQEKAFNLYLDDKEILTSSDTFVTYRDFPNKGVFDNDDILLITSG